MEDFRALRDLMLLLDENEQHSQDDTLVVSNPSPGAPVPKNPLRAKSQRFPDLMINPSIWAFLMGTINDVKKMNVMPKHRNLTLAQAQAITQLENHPDLVIKPTDKGGNIVLMTKADYKQMVSYVTRHGTGALILQKLINTKQNF